MGTVWEWSCISLSFSPLKTTLYFLFVPLPSWDVSTTFTEQQEKASCQGCHPSFGRQPGTSCPIQWHIHMGRLEAWHIFKVDFLHYVCNAFVAYLERQPLENLPHLQTSDVHIHVCHCTWPVSLDLLPLIWKLESGRPGYKAKEEGCYNKQAKAESLRVQGKLTPFLLTKSTFRCALVSRTLLLVVDSPWQPCFQDHFPFIGQEEPGVKAPWLATSICTPACPTLVMKNAQTGGLSVWRTSEIRTATATSFSF